MEFVYDLQFVLVKLGNLSFTRSFNKYFATEEEAREYATENHWCLGYNIEKIKVSRPDDVDYGGNYNVPIYKYTKRNTDNAAIYRVDNNIPLPLPIYIPGTLLGLLWCSVTTGGPLFATENDALEYVSKNNCCISYVIREIELTKSEVKSKEL